MDSKTQSRLLMEIKIMQNHPTELQTEEANCVIIKTSTHSWQVCKRIGLPSLLRLAKEENRNN
jgi:hypothetical protein